jgi:hypothetical protein
MSSSTLWPDSPLVDGDWRDSGSGYPGEAGIGWIVDTDWPYVYSLAAGWLYIVDGGTRDAFYAYSFGGEFWLYGNSTSGWFYSYEPGFEGWTPFNF